MAVSLSLCGCAADYPDTKPKLVDLARNRFAYHDLVDRKNVQYEIQKEGAAIKWRSASGLGPQYCLEPEEIANLNSWAREKQRNNQ